jgi:hypothetical protein
MCRAAAIVCFQFVAVGYKHKTNQHTFQIEVSGTSTHGESCMPNSVVECKACHQRSRFNLLHMLIWLNVFSQKLTRADSFESAAAAAAAAAAGWQQHKQLDQQWKAVMQKTSRR